ncbi:MAG: hypothetical protein F6K13_17350 [Okeania sp. SIO2B9]|nr:hypothetical protein [Okeania sp. SIO2B9]
MGQLLLFKLKKEEERRKKKEERRKEEKGKNGWGIKPQQVCKHRIDGRVLNPKSKDNWINVQNYCDGKLKNLKAQNRRKEVFLCFLS